MALPEDGWSRRRFGARCLGCAIGLIAAPFAAAEDPRVEEIVARHVAALGGAHRLTAIRTLRRSGTLIIPGFSADLNLSGVSGVEYTESRLRPSFIRQETTLQGLSQIAVFNGRDGWEVRAFQGDKDPERMSPDRANSLRLIAGIDSPLVNFRVQGHRLELLEKEEVQGSPAYVIRAQLSWGEESTYWIDVDTLMLMRQRALQIANGTVQPIDTDYGEYQQFGGVWFPMSEEHGPPDTEPGERQKVVYDKVELNVALNKELFAYTVGRRRDDDR